MTNGTYVTAGVYGTGQGNRFATVSNVVLVIGSTSEVRRHQPVEVQPGPGAWGSGAWGSWDRPSGCDGADGKTEGTARVPRESR